MSQTDRPRKLKFLSVDFVTALTIDECRECLVHCNPVADYYVSLQDDNSFSVQRVIPGDKPREVRFWGTLQPVERGTWVWGTIIETTEADRRKPTFVLVFAVAILLALVIEALLRNAAQEALIFAGVLLVLGIVVGQLWRRRHRHGLQVANWVYETLFMSPGRRQPR